MADSSKIEISRNTLLGMVGGMGVCLLVVAFMLGRQSAPVAVPVVAATRTEVAATVSESPSPSPIAITEVAPPPVPPPAPVSAPAPVAPSEPAAAPPPAPQPQPAPAPVVVEAPSLPVSQVPEGHSQRVVRSNFTAAQSHSSPVSHSHPAQPPASNAERAQVQQYLARVDAIMASTGDIGDPNKFATGILSQGANGDASGFDDLLGKTRKARQDLNQVSPPAACREHYHLLTSQLDGSLALLQQVKSATMSMNTSSLPALSAQGQKMQAEADRLAQLNTQIRARYQ